MAEESNLTMCKVCKVLKMRIQDGRYDMKNKKFVDEFGKLWSGKTCPSCHVQQSKLVMRKLRTKSLD